MFTRTRVMTVVFTIAAIALISRNAQARSLVFGG